MRTQPARTGVGHSLLVAGERLFFLEAAVGWTNPQLSQGPQALPEAYGDALKLAGLVAARVSVALRR